MYKVLLVDDESAVLESMRKVIDWEAFGFTVCATADCGEQACNKLAECTPDLVITDVMMPQMNGIELAEYINKNFPKTEMIIISGYDEFDFARSAMRAGVMEYITKPTDKKELESALKAVCQRIQKKSDLEENLKRLRVEAEKSIPILKNQFFSDLANRMIPEEQDLVQSLAYYQSGLSGQPFRLWCFHLDEDERYDCKPEMRELLWVQAGIIIREKMWKNCRYDSFMRGRFLYYIVEDTSLEDILEEVLSEFQNLARTSISVGISREYKDYYNLYKARKDCEAALEMRFNLGNGSCIFYDEVQLFSDEGMEYNQELLNKICMKLRALNKKDAQLLIQKMYTEMKQNKVIYQQVYSQSVLIMTELYGICPKEETKEKIRILLTELHEYKTADMLKNLILELSEEMMEAASAGAVEKNKELLLQIIRYVEEHISDKIALEDVADAVHLSKNYLCSLFKKERGETFFVYLMRVRMEKAKELLRKTEHKVYIIAQMVGYSDYFYFSQVFKKYVGITAGEYREIYDGDESII